MTEKNKHLREKTMRIAAVIVLLCGAAAILIAVGYAPRLIETATQNHAQAALGKISAKLDPLIDLEQSPVVDAAVAADIQEMLEDAEGPVSKGGVLTVMRGNQPLFSLRDRQLMEFRSPTDKQFV